jgi:hypothetical protein
MNPSRPGLVINGVTRSPTEIVRSSVTQITATPLTLTPCTLATIPVATHEDRQGLAYSVSNLWNTDVNKHWLTKDNIANQGFILDYGCEFIIENVFMKQTDSNTFTDVR